MLDLTGIMFSSIMMLVIVIRAIKADQIEPWFQTVKRKAGPPSAPKPPWQRQS